MLKMMNLIKKSASLSIHKFYSKTFENFTLKNKCKVISFVAFFWGVNFVTKP